jgi:lysophospholipid acyltransferase (LPLAT)-like uncharacterized protein
VDRPLRQVFNEVRNTAGTVMVAAVVKALLFTVRYRAEGWESVKPLVQGGEGVLYAFWHDAIMVPLGHESHRNMIAVVSTNPDGAFAARVVRHFGIASMSGTSAEPGASVVIEALRSRPRGHSLVVTPDGPSGPRHRAREGAVFLASRCRLPIVCIGMAFSREWRLRSWDRFRVAKPFSRAEMVFGAPRAIARDLDREGLDRERACLEAELEALTKRAHARAGAPWPE